MPSWHILFQEFLSVWVINFGVSVREPENANCRRKGLLDIFRLDFLCDTWPTVVQNVFQSI